MTTPHVTPYYDDARQAFNTHQAITATGCRITRWHLTPNQRAHLRDLTGQDTLLLGKPVQRT